MDGCDARPLGSKAVSRPDDLPASDLAPLTTLQLGGPAGSLVACSTQDELIQAVRSDAPVLVLAGGSNVVVADDGFPGLVALVETRGIEREGERLTVEAGEPWDDVVAMTVSEGLAGFECLSGIPGSTGATPIQNVGAYGQEVSATVRTVRVLDRAEGRVEELPPERCGFAYRTSIFKYSDRHLVLAVTFELKSSELSEPIRYPELARRLDVEVGERAPLAEVREAVLGLRRGKGMVVDPADPDSVSAGSFFTNQRGRAGRGGAPRRRAAAGVPGGRRPGQDVSGVADRARRIQQGLRGWAGGAVDQAHAGAGQPWRRDHRTAGGAGARDRGRGTRALRRRAAARAGVRGPLLVSR